MQKLEHRETHSAGCVAWEILVLSCSLIRHQEPCLGWLWPQVNGAKLLVSVSEISTLSGAHCKGQFRKGTAMWPKRSAVTQVCTGWPFNTVEGLVVKWQLGQLVRGCQGVS